MVYYVVDPQGNVFESKPYKTLKGVKALVTRSGTWGAPNVCLKLAKKKAHAEYKYLAVDLKGKVVSEKDLDEIKLTNQDILKSIIGYNSIYCPWQVRMSIGGKQYVLEIRKDPTVDYPTYERLPLHPRRFELGTPYYATEKFSQRLTPTVIDIPV